jgi:hypothetical protein
LTTRNAWEYVDTWRSALSASVYRVHPRTRIPGLGIIQKARWEITAICKGRWRKMENNDKLGALWEKSDPARDSTYFTGTLEGPLSIAEGEKLRIVCFSNKKTKDTQPDYNILKSKPREGGKAPEKSGDFNETIPF